jgi:hypothetical protein
MNEQTLQQQILELSLKDLYLIENQDFTELPKHQIWQAPLMCPHDMSDLNELDQRIKKAGQLWLKNRDLIAYNTLIITHKTAWISYIFQRIQNPNQSPLNVIIPKKILKNGIVLPPYPLIYQEFSDIINVAQLQSLIKTKTNR